MPKNIHSAGDIRPGEFYEDCAFHPCLCTRSSEEDDEISGISLVDGSSPRCCSPRHCGVRKLELPEVLHWKYFGPNDCSVPTEHRWWGATKHQAWMEVHRLREQS